MKIAEVISRVDALYPNTYTAEEKLRWCYEVSCAIRDNVKRIYLSFEQEITEDGGGVIMPPGMDSADIHAVYVNNKQVDKADDRTLSGSGLLAGDRVRVVYKSFPGVYLLGEDGAVPDALTTEVGAPYDTLYIDYVMSQIAFYQNDMYDYNKFITMYNQKLAECAAKYAQTAPRDEGRRFYNLWR